MLSFGHKEILKESINLSDDCLLIIFFFYKWMEEKELK